MTKKKKPAKRKQVLNYNTLNLPTLERMRKGSVLVRNNRAQVENPLRIDKLLAGGVIDEMQHLYGIQIVTLWNIASRPFLKSMQYERVSSGSPADFEGMELGRMNAEDQFYKTMGFLRPRDYALICRVCFQEQGALEAGRALGLPINSITVYVRAAFDALGDALARMRETKREIEKPKREREKEDA